MTKEELEKRNAEREAQIEAMLKSGDLGSMTECCMGTTIGDIALSDGKIKKKDTDNK